MCVRCIVVVYVVVGVFGRRWFVECSRPVVRMMMMMIMEKKALYLMTRTTWEYTQTPCSRALGIYLCAREEEEEEDNNIIIIIIVVVVVVQTKG